MYSESSTYLTERINNKSTNHLFVNPTYIASGAFGDVFKSVHLIDNQEYAIKKIPIIHQNLEMREQILQEVRLLAGLSHENIIRYYNCWIDNRTDFIPKTKLIKDSANVQSLDIITPALPQYNLYIQTELMQMNLRHYLERFESTEKQRKYIFFNTLKAIHFLHNMNIVHSDIKPSNILINLNKKNIVTHVKLTDFGLASVIGKPNLLLKYYGTDLYSDPILLDTDIPIPTSKTDIYSLGILGFQLKDVFSTQMELIEQTNKFKKYEIKTDTIIDDMISHDHEKRPDLKDILQIIPV